MTKHEKRSLQYRLARRFDSDPRRIMEIVREEIEKTPLTEEPPKGEWIDISTGKGILKNRSVKCSKCGNTLDLDGVNCGRGDANYCPNCGADMRGKANE